MSKLLKLCIRRCKRGTNQIKELLLVFEREECKTIDHLKFELKTLDYTGVYGGSPPFIHFTTITLLILNFLCCEFL